MVSTLGAARGWLFSGISILGVLFSFLFFGSRAGATVDLVWVYALAFFLLCIIIWLVGAVFVSSKAASQRVANIRAVFSPTNNAAKDLFFLLDPNDNFSPRLGCSIYHMDDGIEICIGTGYVAHVQDDRKIHINVRSREAAQSEVWKKIESNDKTIIERLRIKVGESVV
jgi:hypothetical protein